MKTLRGLSLVFIILVTFQAEAKFLTPDPVKPNPENGQNFNRYWYADNNPIKNIDPDGREVAGIYDLTNELLFLVDKDTRAWALVQGASGGKPYGDPIPSGKYDILERAGRDGFYRLERRDDSYGNDESGGRTNFRLHGPGRTMGCIEVCMSDGFKHVRSLLENTSKTKAEVDSQSVGGRLMGLSESLKKFGSIGVLPSGYSLGFNQKTNSVVMRYTETGSRIVKQQKICTVSKDGTCK